jgi:hypothetical protein
VKNQLYRQDVEELLALSSRLLLVSENHSILMFLHPPYFFSGNQIDDHEINRLNA